MVKELNKTLLNDVTIEITNQCQLHCQHCGIWAEQEKYELDAALVVRIILELLERYKVNFISITGGEPFLHPHCGKLLEAVALFYGRKDITGFGVYTNGACFNKIKHVLAQSGDRLDGMEMGISIDGCKKTHDKLRGSGSYENTLKTIEYVKNSFSKDISLEFKFTINSLNYKELKDVYHSAKDFNAGFSPKMMEHGVSDYYHRAGTSQVENLALLTPMMVESVKKQIGAILAEEYDGIDRELVEAVLVLLKKGRASIRACETPGRSLFITSRGEVYPCLYLSSVGKIDENGKLPEGFDQAKDSRAHTAAAGQCPRCFAYHGFLKKFNLKYLEERPAQQHLSH